MRERGLKILKIGGVLAAGFFIGGRLLINYSLPALIEYVTDSFLLTALLIGVFQALLIMGFYRLLLTMKSIICEQNRLVLAALLFYGGPSINIVKRYFDHYLIWSLMSSVITVTVFLLCWKYWLKSVSQSPETEQSVNPTQTSAQLSPAPRDK